MSKLKTFIAAVGLMGLVFVPALASGSTAHAASCAADGGIYCVNDGANNAKTGSAKTNDLNKVIKLVVNIMLFIIGALSVIMIVVGGIKYTVSNGNAEQIKSAKNTIMYAIAGLIVAILAYAIVNFVVSQLT